MIFVDTNVLIDLSAGGAWFDWSERQVNKARHRAGVINHVVLAELAPGFTSSAAVTAFVDASGLSIVPFSADAAFLAGRAHAAYRQNTKDRLAILPDFLIGGHALSLGATLLTRDRQRFASYFPDLTLITPETDA